MKKQRFTESQIMRILKQVEGGMSVALLSEMKVMAEKNKRLKRMYAES